MEGEWFMGTGILICGLNGVGKSTLGKALAEKLRFHFIDNEDLYFPKTDPDYIYASPRTRAEVERLLFSEIRAHEDFVFASVKGDYGEISSPFFDYAVLIDVPRDIRIRRVKIVLFRNLEAECFWEGIYMSGKRAFLTLLNPRRRIPLRSGRGI